MALIGPDGPIAVTGVSRLTDTQYEIAFDPQSTAGNYQLVVGPNIVDSSGNAMDQDGDGVNGESVEDRFVVDFTSVQFAAQFDFGTPTSAVEAGYIQVTPSDLYSASAGYGYVNSSVQSVTRLGGTLMTYDLHYAAGLTFEVDVPNSVYDVELTVGDLGPYAHELMAVSFEGVAVDVVSTLAGEVLTLEYSGVTVNDGQLTLSMQDQGGFDSNVVLNGLSVTWVGEDITAPRVIGSTPEGDIEDRVDQITLTFNKPIDSSSFTTSDVVALSGPNGSIAVDAVNQLSENQFEIVFAEQSSGGDYSYEVGPDILDLNGRPLDQDQDGVLGEVGEDAYLGGFTILPFTAKYDFGLFYSPVETGYLQVTPSTLYSSTLGFGYLGGSVRAVDRSAGTAMSRDIHYSGELNFAADVPDGLYEVTLHIGDQGPYAHEQMAVFLEGVQVDIVSTAPGELRTVTYSSVSVTDSQLQIRLQDVGGPDVNVVLACLEIVTEPSGAGTSGLANYSSGSQLAQRSEGSLIEEPIRNFERIGGKAVELLRRTSSTVARDVVFGKAYQEPNDSIRFNDEDLFAVLYRRRSLDTESKGSAIEELLMSIDAVMEQELDELQPVY